VSAQVFRGQRPLVGDNEDFSQLTPLHMNSIPVHLVPFLIECVHCNAHIIGEHPATLELASQEAVDALPRIAGEAGRAVCTECGGENEKDLPFTVYDPQMNRLYHCLRSGFVARLDLVKWFEPDGSPSAAMLEAAVWDFEQGGPRAVQLINAGIRDPSFSFRFFSTPLELMHQAFLAMAVGQAHRERAAMYAAMEPPEDFLTRGSRLYKRRKLKFIYCLGQSFADGEEYTQEQVDRKIRRERMYLDQCDVDDSHARVALIELNLLERTADGRVYWRKPADERIDGLCFPSQVEGYEKSGFCFYSESGVNFSVTYRSEAAGSGISFYVYESAETPVGPESVERQFQDSREQVFERYELENRSVVMPEVVELKLEDNNAPAQPLWHLTLCVNGPEEALERAHLVVSSWRGRFIKVRMTGPCEFEADDGLVFRFLTGVLKANGALMTITRPGHP